MKLKKTKTNINKVCWELQRMTLTRPQQILLTIVGIQMEKYGFISDDKWERLKEIHIATGTKQFDDSKRA